MSSFTGYANRPDRAKAIAAVAVGPCSRSPPSSCPASTSISPSRGRDDDDLRLIEPKPPPPPPPPPKRAAQMPRRARGRRRRARRPSRPRSSRRRSPIPGRSPIPAAPVAGQGSATARARRSLEAAPAPVGAASGRGGGGAGFTPARRISKIPDREYRQLAATGIAVGQRRGDDQGQSGRERIALPRCAVERRPRGRCHDVPADAPPCPLRPGSRSVRTADRSGRHLRA